MKVNTCCCGRYISYVIFLLFIFSQCGMKIGARNGETRGYFKTLIKIWADEEIQQEFEKSRRNAGTFVKIAQSARE